MWMCDNENARLLRIDNTLVCPCFAQSVLFKATLLKVLNKSCSRGWDYLDGESICFTAIGVSYSFFSPFMLMGICTGNSVWYLISLFSDLSRHHLGSRTFFLSGITELPHMILYLWSLQRK